ncbi:MAG: D-alanyl-D-alanine carboxypeptidase family protein [Sciscionella sp.]
MHSGRSGRRFVALMSAMCALLSIAAMAAASPALGVPRPAKHAARATPPLPTQLPPATTTDTIHCPDKLRPPSPVDSSERAAPGSTVPQPVPLPPRVIGGPRMAECGYVIPPGAPALPRKLDFQSWVITDLDSGAVLAARDPHGRERPASIIKTLLALVVLDNLDPGSTVTGTQADANQEGTRVGIGPGGHYTVNQLLHGLLMHSGNDIAYALAMQLGGVRTTVAKMDAMAARLGAEDTRVARPSGLDGAGMSTSAYDMAVIFSAAMEKPLFAQSVKTRTLHFPGYPGKHGKPAKPGYQLSNDNHLLGSYPGDLGGKTGFTDDALHTYLNAAHRHGHRIGLVMMRGMNHLAGMYDNAVKLMNYGFTLEAAHAAPVGQVVSAAPQAPPTDPPTAGGTSAPSTHPPGSVSAAAAHSPSRTPELIALLALVAIVVAAAATLLARRRRTR